MPVPEPSWERLKASAKVTKSNLRVSAVHDDVAFIRSLYNRVFNARFLARQDLANRIPVFVPKVPHL